MEGNITDLHDESVCEDGELCVCDAYGHNTNNDEMPSKEKLWKTSPNYSEKRKRRDLNIKRIRGPSRRQNKVLAQEYDSVELETLKNQVKMRRQRVKHLKVMIEPNVQTQTPSTVDTLRLNRIDNPTLETKTGIPVINSSRVEDLNGNGKNVSSETCSPFENTKNKIKSMLKQNRKPKIYVKKRKIVNAKSESARLNGKGKFKRTLSDTMIDRIEPESTVSNSARCSTPVKEATTDESLLNISLPTPRTAEYCATAQDLGLESMTSDQSMSDSDEEFPEGLTPIRCNESKSLSVGDVVWAKFRTNFYLPAIVKINYKKKKRVTVVYFAPKDDFNKPCSMSYSCILPFYTSKKDEILQEGEDLRGAEKEMFKLYMDRLEDFLSKKASKMLKNDDVWSYFKPEELDVREEDERIESSQETGETEEKPTVVFEQLSKKGVERKEKLSEKSKPLSDFLISETTKEHLKKIFMEETSSNLNALFKTGSMKEKLKMKHRGFGPIDDEKQIEAILMTYLEWLEEWNKSPYLHKINYVFDVMVPEAIVNALVKAKGYGRKKAWEMFDKGVRRTKEELKLISQTMSEKLDEEEVQDDQIIRIKPKKLILT